jgi:hypothetical protein
VNNVQNDQLGFGEGVVDHVGSVELGANPLPQLVTLRADLGIVAQWFETLCDLPDERAGICR